MLSSNFAEARRLRSTGNYGAALSLIQSSAMTSDEDAFEALVFLFASGNFHDAVRHGTSYTWTKPWCRSAAEALSGLMLQKDPASTLSLARSAASQPGVSTDAIAIYLIALQSAGLLEEARGFVQANLPGAPPNEPFLCIVMAEIAAATPDWARVYSLALAALSADANNFRALTLAGVASHELGGVHEALGYASRAHLIRQDDPTVALVLMRGMNRTGDYYGAIGAFGAFGDAAASPEMLTELGIAHSGLGNDEKAVASYTRALDSGHPDILAIRNLLEIHADTGASSQVEELCRKYRSEIDRSIDCVKWLGAIRLRQRDLSGSKEMFRRSLSLTQSQLEVHFSLLPWPVPEPRLRHDHEQLELLEQRGKLNESAARALAVLKRYYGRNASADGKLSPAGAEADALRRALTDFHYVPEAAIAGRALGDNDYPVIEQSYLHGSPSLVVIDNFLTQEALLALRRFCEEATVWKSYYANGYVGAFMSRGFCPAVLLQIADELRAAMPRVIADSALMQAWGFKYDQRMRGINLHADVAKVNVNLWITPSDACEDKSTGGMLIYDLPPPRSWPFQDYNRNQAKTMAFLEEQGARPQRVPYRENRCVLFDSALLHTTDELHFKPGYTNRRVNVTLLYGRGL